MLEKALSYFEQNKNSALERLKELVRIPSVSFEHFPPETLHRSAEAVSQLFRRVGLENTEIIHLNGAHPYVYADWLHAPGKPTVLLYAHHDVQPPGRDHLWKSQPFEPTVRDGRLFGRGTADDKAGVVVHTAAIESFLKTSGKLPLNVKLLIEGEEEIGSPHLGVFLEKYKRKLQADAIILTDTQNYDTGVPAITVSLRGLAALEVEVRALERSVHSGMLGGPVPDAAQALCKMLATVTDTEGRLAVPGILNEIKAVSPREKQAFDELPYSEPEFRYQAGFLPNSRLMPALDGTSKPLIQMWREPSFSINAFESGSRKAAANIINEVAWAKVGIRLVPNMNPERTIGLLMEHLKRVAPWGVEVHFKTEINGPAWVTEPKGKAFEAALVALEQGYGKKPVLMGTGGTIPFVEPFARELGGVPALLIGVEDPYTNAHSENESMSVSDFEKSIRSAIYFYEEFSR